MEIEDLGFVGATRIAQSIGGQGQEIGKYDKEEMGRSRHESSQYQSPVFSGSSVVQFCWRGNNSGIMEKNGEPLYEKIHDKPNLLKRKIYSL